MLSSDIHIHDFEHKAFQAAKRDGGVVLVWGTRLSSDLAQRCRDEGIQLWRIEDGFLRSVGLGSNIIKPLSLAVDTQGIYYDPSQPSDIENLLNKAVFTQNEKQQAQELIDLITNSRLSKYNVDQHEINAQNIPEGKKVIFIPGQVADDASIRLGCIGDVKSNLELIKRVRKDNPDAFIIYKPHPDVVTGNRRGLVNRSVIKNNVDLVLPYTNIHEIFNLCDEVHTLTSFVGFEALMRGRKVYCYGAPFYAGWGLTIDTCEMPRRKSRRDLTDLVTATLIRYPLYYNWNAGKASNALKTAQTLAKCTQKKVNTRVFYIVTQIGRIWRIITNTLLSYRLK